MGLRSWLVRGMSDVGCRWSVIAVNLITILNLKKSAHYKIRRLRQRRRSGLLYRCPNWSHVKSMRSSGQARNSSHVISPSLVNQKKIKANAPPLPLQTAPPERSTSRWQRYNRRVHIAPVLLLELPFIFSLKTNSRLRCLIWPIWT